MNPDLNIAKEAALEAGKLILSYYKSDYEIKEKGYHNPVTTADHAADKKIKEILNFYTNKTNKIKTTFIKIYLQCKNH